MIRMEKFIQIYINSIWLSLLDHSRKLEILPAYNECRFVCEPNSDMGSQNTEMTCGLLSWRSFYQSILKMGLDLFYLTLSWKWFWIVTSTYKRHSMGRNPNSRLPVDLIWQRVIKLMSSCPLFHPKCIWGNIRWSYSLHNNTVECVLCSISL